jgi:hypothetical protein
MTNDLQTVVNLIEVAARILRTAARDARAGCTAGAVLDSVKAGLENVEKAKTLLEKP